METNTPTNQKDETWEEAQERRAYQSADMQDYENKTGSYAEPTNRVETNNIPLQMLADLLSMEGLRKHFCVNDFGYSQIERDIVTTLTNWQKEEEKREIDKLNRTIDGLLETGSSKLSIKQMSELEAKYKALEESHAELLERLEFMTTMREFKKRYDGGSIDKKNIEAIKNAYKLKN